MAITSQGQSRAPGLPLYALGAGNFIVGIGAFIVIGILAPMLRDLGLSKGEAGALLTVYAIVYALASPVLVAMTGRFERRDVMLVGLALFVLGAFVSAVAAGHMALLGARVLAALGAALFTPVASSAGVALVEPEDRPKALGIVFGGLTIAQVVGVPLGSYLGYVVGWRSAFWAVVVLGVLVIPLILATVPRAIQVPPASFKTLIGVLRSLRLVLAVAFTVFFMGAAYVVYTFIAPMMEARFGLGANGVTFFLVVFGAGAVIGNALGATLTSRFGPDRTLVLLAVGQIVLLPALTLLPVDLWLAIALTLVWSLGAWSFMVPQQSRLIALAPQYQGLLLALNASAIYLGVSIGSTIGSFTLANGGAYESLGPAGAVVASLALISLCAVKRLQQR